MSRLEDVAMLRKALDALATKLDGRQAAAKTVARKSAIVYNALDYAVDLKALSDNNLSEVKWTAPKTVRAIDKRVVINVQQAGRLLSAVAAQKVEGQPRQSSGPTLRAFLAVMYYAALRSEDVAMLSKPDLQLPETGWGELLCRNPLRPRELRGPTRVNGETGGSSNSAERERGSAGSITSAADTDHARAP